MQESKDGFDSPCSKTKLMKDSTKLIKSFAEWIAPQTYLEIGVRYAETINEIASVANRVIGVDPDSECEKYIKAENIELVLKTSDDFFANHGDSLKGKVDMIFIDGLHTKEQVKKDFTNSLQVISEGGWIFLHDTFPPDQEHTKSNLCGDTWEFAWELKNTLSLTDFEFITFPWFYGITCVRGNRTQVSFLGIKQHPGAK